MRQSAQRLAERRSEAQQTGTFTFWFRRPQSAKPAGAWMLAQSREEAAFLTAAHDAPRVGEQLELSESCEANRAVRAVPRGSASHLPRFGRVVCLDDPQGVTRRVAIRFDSQPTLSQD
jgi:hypothetical protein